MNRLRQNNLHLLKPGVQAPSYDRSLVTAGIVHFGIGNFHRTHQAVYCDRLLAGGATEWGIIGVSLRSAATRNALAEQDFLYTEVSLGETTRYRIIGSLLDILVAPEAPEKVIAATAAAQTQLITTTITEKGYCLKQGRIDVEHPDFAGDLQSLAIPTSIYGYLAAAIITRQRQGGPPVTVLCCDNVTDGGEYLKQGVSQLLKQHAPASLPWVERQVAFGSSMVDRISPVTDGALKQTVAEKTGLGDNWPVSAEPFSQWLIQDRFAGKRPDFDTVGAEFVTDPGPCETMKLRLLNGAHSMTAVLGYLRGETNIHRSLQHADILAFVSQALRTNILPVTAMPAGFDGGDYIEAVLQRFQNAGLAYSVLQVGADSSQKIRQRWLPAVDEALAGGGNTAHLAFALAAWVAFVRHASARAELDDPQREAFLELGERQPANPVRCYLLPVGAQSFRFFGDPNFMASVTGYFDAIVDTGFDTALANFLDAEEARHA